MGLICYFTEIVFIGLFCLSGIVKSGYCCCGVFFWVRGSSGLNLSLLIGCVVGVSIPCKVLVVGGSLCQYFPVDNVVVDVSEGSSVWFCFPACRGGFVWSWGMSLRSVGITGPAEAAEKIHANNRRLLRLVKAKAGVAEEWRTGPWGNPVLRKW